MDTIKLHVSQYVYELEKLINKHNRHFNLSSLNTSKPLDTAKRKPIQTHTKTKLATISIKTPINKHLAHQMYEAKCETI
jgi:hypothetical protein